MDPVIAIILIAAAYYSIKTLADVYREIKVKKINAGLDKSQTKT